MTTMRQWVWGGIFLVGSVSVATAVTAAPNEVKVHELAPGVYFRKAQTEPVFTGCNQGWVVFRDYVLIIDANFPGQADEVVRTIRQYTDKPIRFVFDTHYHGDHADGNPQYVKLGATILAHERSQPLFQTKGITAFSAAQKDPKRESEYGGLTYAIPSLYFSHKLIFDDGEQRVELLFLGHAHTAGDAVAWLPKHGILFTGDACVNGAFNYTGDSDTASWIATLGAMQELGAKRVAPGHGEPATHELLATQRRYFQELRAAVQKGVDAGRTLDQIKAEIDLPFYKEWTGVEVKTRVENIEHVHRELTAGKRPLEKDRKLSGWEFLPGSGGYSHVGKWERILSCDADARWSALADLYWAADAPKRKQIRDRFAARTAEHAEMVRYVERMGSHLERTADPVWLRRAIVIAAIEGGRGDALATRQALAVLKYGAEQAQVGTDGIFREVQHAEFIAPENRPLFEAVRVAAAADLAAAALAAGPERWRNP